MGGASCGCHTGEDECVPWWCDTGTAPGVAAGGKTAGGLRSKKSKPLMAAADDEEADGAGGGGLRLLPYLEGDVGPWCRCEPTPAGLRVSLLLLWLCSEELEEQ